MSTGRRLPFHEAYELARQVSLELGPTVDELKCVGSVRRQRPTVGDIEFLARPLFQHDLLGGSPEPIIEPIRDAMHRLGTWKKGRDRLMVVTNLLGVEGLQLDLYLQHPPSSWGSLLAIRTGPRELGRYCVTRMRARGYRHDQGHVRKIGTEELVPTDTEEQFFELAGVPCVPPRERDALLKRLPDPYAREEAAHR